MSSWVKSSGVPDADGWVVTDVVRLAVVGVRVAVAVTVDVVAGPAVGKGVGVDTFAGCSAVGVWLIVRLPDGEVATPDF